jgi:hypothetical protein
MDYEDEEPVRANASWVDRDVKERRAIQNSLADTCERYGRADLADGLRAQTESIIHIPQFIVLTAMTDFLDRERQRPNG